MSLDTNATLDQGPHDPQALPGAERGKVAWPETFPATWGGVERRPLLELLVPAFEARPNHRPLQFDDGYSITNRELQDGCERFAGYLRARVGPGDRVLLAMGNRTEFVIAYLAIVATRGVVVSVSPEVGIHEADYVVADSDCKVAVVDSAAAHVLREVMGHSSVLMEVIEVDGPEPHGFHTMASGADPFDLAQTECQVEDLVDIGYTSGTTGLPKALGGSHLELLRYLDISLRTRMSQSPDASPEPYRLLMPLQLHYGDPLTALCTAIVSGNRLILMRKFSVSRFWEVAREFHATEIMTIGSIPDMLLSRPESPADRDHVITSATALAIPPARHGELERRFGFPWHEIYGSSEAGPAIAMPAAHAHKFVGSGALGIPYPDMTARLVDEFGDEVSGPGTGELEMSGHTAFEGYVNNPEATAEIMHDGWLRSGDIMRRDEHGIFYFQGRRKELIRRSGINIAPAEIEAVLRLHPHVLDAAVVPVEDEVMGEEVKAYVEMADGVDFVPRELVDFCAARLNRQKVPRYIEQRLDPFPRTPTQRIPKSQLKVDGRHTVDRAWDRQGDAVADTPVAQSEAES
jgi:crotonobetaine/carnitine-CoA ligase